MNYSLTQAGNIAALVGFAMLVIQWFKLDVPEVEIKTVIEAVVVLAGIIASWIGRFRKGDLNIFGFRK